MERQFYKAWIFAMDGRFTDPRSPGLSVGGQTISIAFDKADNRHISPSP